MSTSEIISTRHLASCNATTDFEVGLSNDYFNHVLTAVITHILIVLFVLQVGITERLKAVINVLLLNTGLYMLQFVLQVGITERLKTVINVLLLNTGLYMMQFVLQVGITERPKAVINVLLLNTGLYKLRPK